MCVICIRHLQYQRYIPYFISSHTMLRSILKKNNIIGMIHLLPLPGSPRYDGNIQKIIEIACKEAELYTKYEIGGIIIENMNDVPYVKSKLIGFETVSSMTTVCNAVRNIIPSSIACGVQILAGGNEQALAVAQACGCDFIRAEGYVFGHVGDEGYIDSCAGSLLRFRSKIKANSVQIFADIQKKHSSHSITNDLSIEEIAKAAEFFCCDGIILTGAATGEEASVQQLKNVKKTVNIPVIIGSGITRDNIQNYLDADALIIGSHFKYDGRWNNGIDEIRLSLFMDKYSNLVDKKF